MRYREIEVKGILAHVHQPDTWFGLMYNMNLYRGCEHQCIYCDTRSECYQIEDFDHEVLVKTNAIDLLKKTLPRKKVVGTIGFGSMNDCYGTVETVYHLTEQALAVVAEMHFPVHIITKSDLVVRDLALLKRINRVLARVSFTITTTDDDLAAVLEPGAPSPSRRLAAMKTLAAHGISTGVTMMPVLPFIEDNPENIVQIVQKAADCGAEFILPAFGMSCRNRQREYYYKQLDEHFPGISKKYRQRFGEAYSCNSPRQNELSRLFTETCQRLNIATCLIRQPNFTGQQLALF